MAQKPRRPKPGSAELTEAKTFLTKVVEEWTKGSDDKKIKLISLYEFAKRWSNESGGPKEQAAEMKKDINSLNALMRRATQRALTTKVAAYKEELTVLQKEYDDFILKHNIVVVEKEKKVRVKG